MSKKLSLLILARQNIFGLRGEDTEFVLNLKPELMRLGWHVTLSCTPRPILAHDVVHALSCREEYALQTIFADKPFVLSPFYNGRCAESIPNRLATKSLADHYLFKKEIDTSLLPRFERVAQKKVAPNHNLSFTLAGKMLVRSKVEKELLQRDFPQSCGKTEIISLPIVAHASCSTRKLEELRSKFGFGRYMVNVGALGEEGNQLALLHALKDEPFPLIIVNQATLDPAYSAACQKVSRAGLTIFTGPITQEDQAGLILNAAACVQPNTSDSSGLNLAQSYRHGVRLVAPDRPILKEKLFGEIYYCHPHQPESILAAVKAALSSLPKAPAAEQRALTDWSETAAKLDQIYREALKQPPSVRSEHQRKQELSAAQAHLSLSEFRDGAAMAIVKGVEGTSQIEQYLENLLKFLPGDLELQYYLALSWMMKKDFGKAQNEFCKVIEAKPDCPLVVYLLTALCALFSNDKNGAARILEQGVALTPFLTLASSDLVRTYIKRGLSYSDESALLMEMRQILLAGHELKIGAELNH